MIITLMMIIILMSNDIRIILSWLGNTITKN